MFLKARESKSVNSLIGPTRTLRSRKVVFAISCSLFVATCTLCILRMRWRAHLVFERPEPETEELCLSGKYPSLLACVTGSWSFEGGRTEERLLYLRIILKNYVAACEAGYNVTVVLLLYAHTSANDFEKYVSLHNYRCERIFAPIAIKVRYFEHRPIPGGAHGTGQFTDGDLAIRHREVFLQHRNDFDVFLVQEDDVSIEAENLNLFRKSLCVFRNSDYYPALYDTEIKNGTRYLSWRFRSGTFTRFGNRTVFRTNHVDWGGRAYIITSKYLREFVKDPLAWFDPSKVKGEFNPEVASSAWFADKRKLAILIDTDEWRGGDIHHLSNRFVNFDVEDSYFEMPTLNEVSKVFRNCSWSPQNNTTSTDAESHVDIVGDDCLTCLNTGGSVKFTSEISTGTRRVLEVQLECSAP